MLVVRHVDRRLLQGLKLTPGQVDGNAALIVGLVDNRDGHRTVGVDEGTDIHVLSAARRIDTHRAGPRKAEEAREGPQTP